MPVSALGPMMAMRANFVRSRGTGFFVPQENDALLGDAAGGFKSGFHVNYAFFRRVIDDAGGEFRAQNATHVIVDFRHGDLARLHGLL